MSKGKKTIEELLEEALVPEEEQQYEVPENWIWVKTGGVNEIVTGSTPSKKNALYYDGDFPFIKPADLEQGDQVIHASEYLSEEGKLVSRVVPKESTLVCCIGSIGKTGLSVVECTTNQQINSLIPNKRVLNPKFNYYQVLNGEYQSQLWKRSSATTVSIINKSKMSEIPITLPPLNEQKRIAEKVERLLSKIEEAKQLIEEAKETFEIRRAAILDKAFRGELTKKWREDNSTVESFNELLEKISSEKERTYLEFLEKANEEGSKKPTRPKKFNNNIVNEDAISLPYKWGYCTLGDVIYDFKYGTSEKSDYDFKGTPVIRIPNIGEEYINTDDLKYLKESSNDFNTSVLEGDILIVRSNGSKDLVGKCSIVQEGEEEYAFASYLIRLRPVLVVPEFILWLLKSDRVKEQFFSKSKSSAGINNINTEELATTIIPLPPVEEQREIVKKLKVLLTKEDETKTVLDLDNYVGGLKQSILSKAFRGELGTNNPNEENAIELLKEVLQEQVK